MTTAAVEDTRSTLYGPSNGLRLPYAASSAGMARGALRQALPEWLSERVDDAVLLVTEVVSNAVIHGRPGIELAIATTERGVRVSVTDTGAEMPVRKPAWAGGHRGLEIVDQLSDSWGYDELPAGGKTVWFEITR